MQGIRKHAFRQALEWLSTAALALGCVAAAAEYPDKPIKVVSPYAAGNSLDIPLYQLNEFMQGAVNQQVIIDHKPGAAAILAAQQVAHAPGDGYTVLLGPMGVFVTNPHTYNKLPYSYNKSFKPVTNFMGAPLVLAVNSKLGVNSVQELVAYAKKHPGEPAYASFAAGNASHFAGALFNRKAGITMLHVPYNGTPLQIQSLVGGQVMAAFTAFVAVQPHLSSGKVKVLATTGGARSPLMPDVPTFKELGYPELEINMWTGLFVPASTPDAVVRRLNALVTQALETRPMLDKLKPLEIYPKPTTPGEFQRFIDIEYRKWGEAVRLTGFKAQE